jgi:predicted PurR-regulated permease PerM
MIMLPFANIILWGLILTLAFDPLHKSLSGILGGRPKLAAGLILLISLTVVIVPSVLFMDSMIDGIKGLRANYQAGTLTIPAPSEKVKTWPVIGNSIYNLWQSATMDLGQFIVKYKDQLAVYGGKIGKGVLSATGGILQMLIAVVIAVVMLILGGTKEALLKFFIKVAGNKGDEFANVVNLTIGNVVKGILGVALIQAVITGLGFLFAGIPLAGLWTLLVFIFAVLQLPVAIIVVPIIAYMFSEFALTPAIIWTIYLLIAGLSDNVLKPILLGKGAPVPMLVIFIGVIGGFIFSGFIGLFTGAVVMSIGYKLFISWLDSAEENGPEKITK